MDGRTVTPSNCDCAMEKSSGLVPVCAQLGRVQKQLPVVQRSALSIYFPIVAFPLRLDPLFFLSHHPMINSGFLIRLGKYKTSA